MGMTSIWHWLILLVVVLLLFGAGKIPKLMGDMASGIKAFKKGMKDDDEASAQAGAPAPQVTASTNVHETSAEKPKV
ncbi:MAG: twin-arginine translocase TatA/TatE family subunit [Rhodospirillales bacterium]|nr:twin-arginine translocase TatA/TatE family subunit [Rhodospirillales bacterium]